MIVSLPLAVLLATFAATPTGAPTADEQRLFAEGERAMNAGKPGDAVAAWKAGYELRRDPAFLVRIGEAQEKAAAPADAVESYRRYLREARDAADRTEIEQRIAKLTAGMAPVKPADNPSGAGDNTGNLPGAPGATAPAPPAPAAAHLAAPATDEETARRAAAAGDDTGWNFARATAWISVGLTASLLGVAAFYGASAASKKDDVNRLLTYRDQRTNVPLEYGPVARQYEEAFREGQRNDSRAKLMLVLAGGTAVVATTFFVLDKTRTSRPELALFPDGARLGLVGSWRWSF